MFDRQTTLVMENKQYGEKTFIEKTTRIYAEVHFDIQTPI
jgi:hypothetical protein